MRRFERLPRRPQIVVRKTPEIEFVARSESQTEGIAGRIGLPADRLSALPRWRAQRLGLGIDLREERSALNGGLRTRFHHPRNRNGEIAIVSARLLNKIGQFRASECEPPVWLRPNPFRPNDLTRESLRHDMRGQRLRYMRCAARQQKRQCEDAAA